MGDETVTEDGTKAANVCLEVETANGIRHAVATLDESGCGEVPKSQLQAVVANVSRAIKIAYVSDDLDNYLTEKENLTVVEFLDFLESKLLVKGKKLDQKDMDELSWVMVGQKYEDEPHLLTKKDAYKLWLAFKKLDITGELKVDVEELCIVLEKFVRGIGVQWNEQKLNEYAEDGAVTFWKFINCLESKFLVGVDKSILREGLQDLYDTVLDEAMKTGFLYKKGHSMLKTNKSRWFALKPDRLLYYVSSGYREKKGELILNNEATVTSLPDKGSYKYRFTVTCGQTKKEFEMTAPDLRTKQAWIAGVQTVIDCHGGQTPFKKDLLERKAKRDADKARKAEEETRRKEQDDLLSQQRQEIDLLKQRKAEIEKLADEEKAMLDAEIRRREELEEIQRNLQQLLEDQKRAREEEQKVRAAKERLLEEERVKREELEALRLQQQQELQEEKMQKEELIEKQKQQQRILEEERKRLHHLEEERMKAEEAAKAAQDKLTAAETAAKNAADQAKDRVRQLKTSIGLKGTIGPKVAPLVTHRGEGAFTLEEFLNRATEWSGLELEDEEKAKSGARQPNTSSNDELVKATSTAAPNQNLPEFLKKAAAWSGLNPDTYLESSEEKQPPKVHVKPTRNRRSRADDEDTAKVSGEVRDGEGLQVEEGKDAGAADEGRSGENANEEGGSEEKNEASEKEGLNEHEVKERDEEEPAAEEMKNEEVEEEVVKGEESEVVETSHEVATPEEVENGGSQVGEVNDGGSQDSEAKVEEPQVVEVNGGVSQVEEVNGGESQVDGGSKVEDANDGGSRVEEANDGGSQVEEVNNGGSQVEEVNGGESQVDGGSQVEDANDGGSQVEEANDGESQVDGGSKVEDANDGGSQVEEANDGESQERETKDEGGDVEEKNDASKVEVKDEESPVVNGDNGELDNEKPVEDKGDNQCPEAGDGQGKEELCNNDKTDTPEGKKCENGGENGGETGEEEPNSEVCGDNAKEITECKKAAYSANEGEVNENEATSV